MNVIVKCIFYNKCNKHSNAQTFIVLNIYICVYTYIHTYLTISYIYKNIGTKCGAIRFDYSEKIQNWLLKLSKYATNYIFLSNVKIYK